MNVKGFAAIAVLLLCCAVPASAQPVSLRFHDGLVTLKTQNAPLRSILAEWARLGGTTIVNAERVAGAPLTLELNAVSERQAIDVLLRSVSGYMAATRPVGKPGVSTYDRILILPTSTAPRNPPPGPAFQPRPVIQQPQLAPEPDEPEQSEPEEDPVARPGRPQPFGQPQVVDPNADPVEDTAAPTPTNPFGIPAGATSRPGMITPVPQQQPQRTQPDPEP